MVQRLSAIVSKFGAVDWVALLIAFSLSVGLVASVVMEQAGMTVEEDGGTTERIVLAFVGLITLYIGLKLRDGGSE